jgi:cell division protein FtsB
LTKSKQSLQQEQALNKKNARYKVKNEALPVQIKELES